MCNDYGVDIPFSLFVDAFREAGLALAVPEAIPNLEPRDEIWPTETAPVIRAAPGGVALDQMRWGLSGSNPKGGPVINMRGEGRSFARGRCLVPASHFYEFTGAKSPKTRWRFVKTGEDWFCIAGLIGEARVDGRPVPAFTMLTVPPGEDVAPLHNRQVVILERRDWAAWLDLAIPAPALLKPSPAGSLTASLAPRVAA
ncbi:MAG: SOS response-associated peptidase [Caulobacteraceae bacterium]